MKSLIFDSTPLIYLTRVGLVRLFELIPARKYVARSVFREVVERGKVKGLADALALEALFDAKTITIIEPSKKGVLRMFTSISGLEEADAETLAIANEQGYRAVLDVLLARKVARTYGIDFVGTPYLLMIATNTRILTKKEATKAVDEMIEAGWRCGPELYREILRLIEHN